MKKLIVIMVATVMAMALAGSCFAAPADFQLKSSMGNVTFSHKFHLAQKIDGKPITCMNCHTKYFHMKIGADKITMAAIKEGKFCGGCHNGKIAFNTEDCSKCHKK